MQAMVTLTTEESLRLIAKSVAALLRAVKYARENGHIGFSLCSSAARRIQLIIPMPVTKTVPMPLEEILPHMGILKLRSDRVHGMACGMLALPGKVVTERDALRTLFNVKAIPAAIGGVGNRMVRSLALIGEDAAVESAWGMINEIKGEKKTVQRFCIFRLLHLLTTNYQEI